MGTPKATIGPVFTAQLRRWQAYAQNTHQAQRLNGQPGWYIPELKPDAKAAGWSGSLFDLEGIKEAFSRKHHEEDLRSIVKTLELPGCTGDMSATQLQGDFLATMERAYRARHKTWLRTLTHATGRSFGQQHTEGIIAKGYPDYVKKVIKLTQTDRTS